MPHSLAIDRVRAEFLEMPGMRLTFAQAQRLWGLERAICEVVLEALVAARFLRLTAEGLYVRVTDLESRRVQRAPNRRFF